MDKLIAELKIVAREYSDSAMHSESLLSFEETHSGFCYIDSWGLEHNFHFTRNDELLEVVLVTVPLPDCLMDDIKEISVLRIPISSDYKENLCQLIDDYCYRDEPIYSGNSAPYKL